MSLFNGHFQVDVAQGLNLHSQSVEIYIYVQLPDFWCLDRMSLVSEQLHHDHIHAFAIHKLVILIIDVLDELHNIDRMAKSCDPCLKLGVFFLDSLDQVKKHDIKALLQHAKLFLFFTRIVIDDFFDIVPNDSLAFLMESATLIEMFGTCFAHESRHSALGVYAN
jgi:hypothetical protein